MYNISVDIDDEKLRYWAIYTSGAALLWGAAVIAVAVRSTIGAVCFCIALLWWTVAHILSDKYETPIKTKL